ncbi:MULTISPECIES: efflux RND transporter periplasmic adaptor subunit [unclassified Sulfurospirillum]|uniref:efflux RND transporter periplasmic adaptor subunit n=1 Tax=unclassified Sulfurospirillum TaxID=2618290 RepID=UPI000500841A|nr:MULTISPECIES: efflux RND transporter periplasmic adaptor subunit [unclassified Sulfurospirillum]KFL33800.1 RND transporter [Sulfurospirillum sp. SCADC]
MSFLKKILLHKFTVLLALLALCVGGYYGWEAYTKPPLEAKYKFHTLELGDVTQSVSANGTLNPLVLVTVGTQVSGKVIKLYVDFNDRVEQGQILAELDPALLDAQAAQSAASVKSAESSLELAIANEKRTRELFSKEYISKQELDASVQALKAARAALDLARAQSQKDRTNQGYTIIRSPVSGVVVDRQIDVGQTVAASLSAPVLFKIAQDLRQMQIDSNFAEADIGRIKVGQKVTFAVDAFPNNAFVGVVKQVRLNATTVSNVVTYDVVVTVENPDEILIPGMTAYVNVILAEKKNVLLVPNAALRYKPTMPPSKDGKPVMPKKEKKESGSATLFVFENGAPKPVKVSVGISDNRLTEIISDELKEGDKIIVEENKHMTSTTAAGGGSHPPMRPF